VFSAETPSGAQTELERLRALAKREAIHLAQIKTAQERQEREREKRQQREKTLFVADQIARTLEDLNYSVGQIDRTAFVSKGHFYAIDNEWPDPRLAVRAECGRWPDAHGACPNSGCWWASQEADARQQLQEDQQFDNAWCSKAGLGEIKKTLANRGITARFKIEHAPGELVLEQVPEESLDQQLRRDRRSRKDGEAGSVRSRSRNTQR